MLKQLKEHHRLNETMFLGFLSISCFALSVFRFVYTDTTVFLFLNWNLFLAFLPWLFSNMIIIYPNLQKRKIIITTLILSWILFFPNAPYILTDLFHLRKKTSMPIWFDMILILSFAWTGLMFGFMSLWNIEKIISQRLKNRIVSLISVGLLFLGSFGIYIGRYLRWNSWDIITEPFGLMYDIGTLLKNPFNHSRTWGMTLLMGLFLNMLYWSFRLIKNRDE